MKLRTLIDAGSRALRLSSDSERSVGLPRATVRALPVESIEERERERLDPIALLVLDIKRLGRADPRWLARHDLRSAWGSSCDSNAMRELLRLIGRHDLWMIAGQLLEHGPFAKADAIRSVIFVEARSLGASDVLGLFDFCDETTTLNALSVRRREFEDEGKNEVEPVAVLFHGDGFSVYGDSYNASIVVVPKNGGGRSEIYAPIASVQVKPWSDFTPSNRSTHHLLAPPSTVPCRQDAVAVVLTGGALSSVYRGRELPSVLGPMAHQDAEVLSLAVQRWLDEHVPDKMPVDVTESELHRDPWSYHGRLIRVTGTWRHGIEESKLSGVWLRTPPGPPEEERWPFFYTGKVRATGLWVYPRRRRGRTGYGHSGCSPGELRAKTIELIDPSPVLLMGPPPQRHISATVALVIVAMAVVFAILYGGMKIL